jgi:phosphatidylserine/phosphatidylglycerophosphate/cardiolipin synthase-like enzyme
VPEGEFTPRPALSYIICRFLTNKVDIMKAAIFTILMLMLTMAGSVSAQQANHIVISEFATRGGSIGNQAGEFVELYNPTSADVDVSGWELQYRSASGSSYNALVRIPDGTTMQAKSFYLITGISWAGTPEADVQWPTSGMADNGNIRIVNGSGTPVDRVGYGTGNDPEGSAAPNHGDAANDNSVERKASASSTSASLAAGGADVFAGNGWDSDDNAADFVVQSSGRNPQNSSSPLEPLSADGSGSATTTLQKVDAAEVFILPIEFRPDPTFTLSAMKIVIPAGMLWTADEADVQVSQNLQTELSVIGDTILFDRLTFDESSAEISIAKLTAPATTGNYRFDILTSGSTTFLPIQNPPTIFVKGGPIPIAEARENDVNGVPVLLGEIVTVNGIVTVANEFGAPAYVEDHTGGIAVYDFTFSDSVSIGDEVTITGTITHFNGLTEMENVTTDAKPSTGNAVVPIVVSIPDLLADGKDGDEKYESRLVRLNGVTVNTQAWTVSGSGVNYKLSDGTNEIDVRIDNDVPFAGEPAPGGSFDIVGVISQYQRNSPFVGGYQLMPRLGSDIIASGPRLLSAPVQQRPTETDAVTLSWTVSPEAVAFARYGETDAFEGGVVPGNSTADAEQWVRIAGLDPATIYKVQVFSVAGGDTSFAQPMWVSTRSATSSGTINVYFNQDVDNDITGAEQANADVRLGNSLMNRIDAAQHSIDLCFYSLSGTVGDDIAARLLAAKARGVSVRAIFETDNANTNAIRNVRNNLPSIVDNFDRANAGAGLMHNKFVVIDARDRGSDTDDWVLMGSWNPTEPGTNNDAQNVIEIQDQALAVSYTREFEEMWGSDTETPNSTTSRFGARKLDNTPHIFSIGPNDIPVDLYFSPSDQTTSILLREVERAAHSLYFATLTFTRDDLGRALVDRHDAGILVRGVMDNSSDQGSEFAFLQSEGVDVFLKKGLSGLLHHKYLLIDADAGEGSEPGIVTGSHNWSNSAEFSNNENTLVIRDRAIAEQYLQEWYTRYRDAGGSGVIVLDVDAVTAVPQGFMATISPQPVPQGSQAAVRIDGVEAGVQDIRIFDMLGREVAQRSFQAGSPNLGNVLLPTIGLIPGSYVVLLRGTTGRHGMLRFVVVPAL